MKKTDLKKYLDNKNLPSSINNLIKNIMDEDDAYVADELVELCEEILLQLSAVGISIYLSQKSQKEVFNDFIIDLFTSKANSFNAGPLYKWAAHMLKDLKDEKSKNIKHLFWDNDSLNQDINRISELRNNVMHGFFVLPAERNIEESNHLAKVLQSLIDIKLFNLSNDLNYHFLFKENDLMSFTGNWSIEDSSWINYKESYEFGLLSSRIQFEKSNDYAVSQKELVDNNTDNRSNEELIEYINSNEKGAISCWFRPGEDYLKDYSSFVNYLDNSTEHFTIYQNLESLGVNFTADFLLTRIIEKLTIKLNIQTKSKNNKKTLIQIRKKSAKKIIVVINKIHISLFNNNHILVLTDLFYENNIQLVCFGIYHSWMDKFFNKSFKITSTVENPSNNLEFILSNYLRFKGPDKNVSDQLEDYELLREILDKIIVELNDNKKIIVRQFSDSNNYPVEYVLEAVEILTPFYKVEHEKFKLDEIDKLYDFPKEITESSRVLFSIGRRDTKLEFEHKVITNE